MAFTTATEVRNLPIYGAIYGEEISSVSVDVCGGGLDVSGVVGNPLEFACFFNYLPLTGYEFTGYIVLDPIPVLARRHAIVIAPIDLSVGLVSVSLTQADTLAIGPVSGKPWFLCWVDPDGVKRTVLMGKFSLNRQ